MENSFQTSFIPKKPITSDISRGEPKGLLFLIAIILLVISVVASAGFFVYKTYLIKQKDSASEALSSVHDTFESSQIDELDLFNKRIEIAKQLLNDHTASSSMFVLLGEITIPSIQYTKFEQQTNNTGSFVKIEGLASDYKAIALQADMFNSPKGRFFHNVIFSNLIKDKNNKVTFNLEFQIDKELLSYGKSGVLNQNTDNPVLPQDSLLPNLENNTQ